MRSTLDLPRLQMLEVQLIQGFSATPAVPMPPKSLSRRYVVPTVSQTTTHDLPQSAKSGMDRGQRKPHQGRNLLPRLTSTPHISHEGLLLGISEPTHRHDLVIPIVIGVQIRLLITPIALPISHDRENNPVRRKYPVIRTISL